jgi:hypothetical protein
MLVAAGVVMWRLTSLRWVTVLLRLVHDAQGGPVGPLPAIMQGGGASARMPGKEGAWLTAMALLRDGLVHRPAHLAGPGREADGRADGDWQPSWPLSSQLTVVDVPGGHFTMMSDHARATARAVDDWLTSLPA